MIFAFAGNDIIVTEEDYVAMFIDVDSKDTPISIPKHPLKNFRFSKLCEDLRPSTFSSSNSLESFSTSQRSSTSQDSNPISGDVLALPENSIYNIEMDTFCPPSTHTSSFLVASGSELVDMDAFNASMDEY
ncbi:hypothetical protein BT96DRAFT_1003569 [Gymnopus androsaceus JB14]|uniref:Uncharacterized protein n=1 Tax=Gymnopus androsaceus JB14 TaxID=1447944 RepID=A0A6A4GTG1_9AGAR|nr:hypothetical protein BT96DRAFT_1003569 [Gymnopus androsaceus JB14]